MKEKIFSKIKESLGKTTLSERTLQKKSEILAKTITSDELLTDEVMADVIDELKTYEGQINHDVAEAVKKQKPEPKKEEKQDEPEDDDFKSKILKEIEDLKAERQKEKDDVKKSELKKEIIESLKKNGATNSLALKAALYEASIDYEKSIEDNVKTIRTAYDKEASEMTVTGSPFFGGGGGGSEINESELQRRIEEDAKKFNLKT